MNNLKKKIVATIIGLSMVAMMAPGIAQAITADELQTQIDALMAQLATLQTQLATLQGTAAPTVTGCTITSFDRNLKQGMTGDDVKCLQIVLNSDTATQVAATGVGSSGSETSYFGALTKAAVIKFQEKYASEVLASYGLTAGTGFVGATTRAKLNSLLTAVPVVPTGCDCTDWVSGACGAGTCLATEKEQTRTCTPAAGAAADVCATVATTQCVADVTCVAPAAGLTVALAADTPTTNALPYTATSVPFLKVNFTAGSDADATIEDITFKRVGTGEPGDFEAVYLYDGATRLTDGRSVSVSTNEVTFSNLNYTVEAGKTATLTLKADLAGVGAAGTVSAFQITLATAISTSSAINGTFPVTGNAMTVVAVAGGGVEVDDAGVDTPVNIGDTEVIISSFDVTADGEDIALQSITLTQNGSASLTELDNIVVEKDGESVGEVTISGDQLIIAFEDETIEDGDTETYEVKADISASVNPDDDAIEIAIEEDYDVVAIGLTYGFGVEVGNTYVAEAIEVEGGVMNLSYVGPATQDIGAGDGVKVFSFKVSNADELKVRETVFEFAGLVAGSRPSFDNFRLIDDGTGKTLDSTDTISDANLVTFTNDYTLASGTTTLNVLVDIDEDIYDFGEEVLTVNLEEFGDTDVKDLDTGDYLVADTDIVPNGLTGKDLTILAADLDVALASTPEEQTYVAGEEDAKLAGFVFEAVGAENIIVGDLTFEIAADDTNDDAIGATAVPDADIKLIISSVYLEDGSGNLIASAQNVANDATVAFDNVGWEIEATDTETLVVVGDIRPSAVDDTDVAEIQFTLTAGDYKTSETKARADITVNGGVDGQLMDIGVGGLSVKLDASTPDEAIAVAGETGVAFSVYKFEATTEDYSIEKITVGGWAAGDTDNLDALYLKPSTGTTATKASISGTTATFTGLDWVVPEGKSLKVTVSADIRDLSNDAAQSSEDFKIAMGPSDATLYESFRAVGVSSGTVLNETEAGGEGLTVTNDLLALANAMTVYESKPIVKFVSLSDKVLANATKTIYKFSVDVDETGDETIMTGLTFSVTGVTDGTLVLNNAKLYRTGKTAAIVESDETLAGTVAADGDLTFNLAGLDEEVASLTQYYIAADITGADVDEDLSTRFKDADAAFAWNDGEVDADAALLVIPEDVATLSK